MYQIFILYTLRTVCKASCNELRKLYVEYIYFVCIWYWVPHIGTMKYAYCIQFCNAEREGSAKYSIYNTKKDLHCGILYGVHCLCMQTLRCND